MGGPPGVAEKWREDATNYEEPVCVIDGSDLLLEPAKEEQIGRVCDRKHMKTCEAAYMMLWLYSHSEKWPSSHS